MYKKITSISNLIIKNILSNSLPDDMFFVFGEKIIKELLNFSYKIHNLFILESKTDYICKIHDSIDDNKIILISNEITNRLCSNRKEWAFAIFLKKEKQLINSNYKKAIILDNLQHPNNVGLIIRTALGLGIEQIFLLNGVNQYNHKLISASSSYCLSPNVTQIKSFSEINIENKNIIATALCSNSKEIREITRNEIGENWILVFGNEGNGISNEILNQATLLLNIKMLNNVNSLNVAMCASIVLWELLNKH